VYLVLITPLLLRLRHRLLVRRFQLRLYIRQDQPLVLALHTELALALRRTSELGREPEHIIQGHLRRTHELVLPRLRINDRSATTAQRGDDGGLELDGCDDFDVHDRLDDDRLDLLEGLAECTDRGDAKSELGRVDLVVRPVLEDEPASSDLVP
jgi:hypothetical protein